MQQTMELRKYPRTPHLQGSRLQPGDEPGEQVPYEMLVGRWIVVEEKMDGGNSGISFDVLADLLLQSRGHYLMGGASEKQFSVLKSWSSCHADRLLSALWDQYILYGEWVAAKHSCYYDLLPHLWLEFDAYDRQSGKFLSTEARKRLLRDLPVLSVPVLYAGPAPARIEELIELVKPSLAKSSRWRLHLAEEARRQGMNAEQVIAETDKSDLAEGLYIKVEEGDETVARFKWVRASFVQTILASGTHWHDRPILPNRLAPGVDLYSPQLKVTWENLPFLATGVGLLSRQEFRDQVFRRDGRKCAFCGKPAVDAHHIFDRSLYSDGGLYIGNGVSTCPDCHLDCEESRITVEQAYQAAGITVPVLPPGVFPSRRYDKWGKELC